MNLKDIIFLPLDMPSLEVDYDKLVTVYESYRDNLVPDEYRNCLHMPVHYDCYDTNRASELDWTEFADYLPEVKQYIIDHVEPALGMIPRAMIICTPPQTEGYPHIDCTKDVFDEVQLKFRIVLAGKTSTLYFIEDPEARVYAPEIGHTPFFMAGEWPHGLDNFTENYKFTLALGAPWNCEETPELLDLVERSTKKNRYVRREELTLPDISKYWKTKRVGSS